MQYKIFGEPMPVVECDLQAGETIVCERGSMVWMTPNLEMKTSGGGSVGRAFGRMLSGEPMFQNHYTAQGGPGRIAFASCFPGSIRAVQITPDRPIICQKRSFLASEQGVQLSVYFQKKMGVGLFGGEGFIMQQLSGQGLAFIEIDGYGVEHQLQAGQSMVVDTGSLAMMDASCTMDIRQVPGLKNMVFGGEGLFHTVLTGPGKVILQTMPASRLASALSPHMPTSSS